MSFNLVTILTGQGHISKLCVFSQPSKGCADIFLWTHSIEDRASPCHVSLLLRYKCEKLHIFTDKVLQRAYFQSNQLQNIFSVYLFQESCKKRYVDMLIIGKQDYFGWFVFVKKSALNENTGYMYCISSLWAIPDWWAELKLWRWAFCMTIGHLARSLPATLRADQRRTSRDVGTCHAQTRCMICESCVELHDLWS